MNENQELTVEFCKQRCNHRKRRGYVVCSSCNVKHLMMQLYPNFNFLKAIK